MTVTVRVRAAHLDVTRADGDPKAVGPYRVLGRLGAGGMGVVYLAAAPDGTPAAVKMLHRHLASDREFLARFRREAQLAARVSARSTAAVLATDLDSESPWIATEYVTGPSLAEHVAVHGPLAADALAGFAAGLAEALSGIHRAGIVHRDLTPANVLLAADGPKVVDFGIARALHQTALTATGVVMGTPGWVPPEVARGGQHTTAGDVFCWGGLVAYAASGRAPFGTGQSNAVLFRVVHEPPDLPVLPEPLADLVASALDKDPAARPLVENLLDRLLGVRDQGLATTRLSGILDGTWRLPKEEGTVELAVPTGRGWRLPMPFVLAVAAFLLLAAGTLTARAIPGSPPAVTPNPAAVTAGTPPPTPEQAPSPSGTPATATPTSTGTPTMTSPSPGDSAHAEVMDTPAAAGDRTTQAEATPELSVPAEIASLEGEVVPASSSAYELFSFAQDHVGDLVYLDLRIEGLDELPAGADDPQSDPMILFVHGSYPGCEDEPIYCGAEYLFHDVGTDTDSAVHWMRGSWRVSGHYAVAAITGPFQGSFSVSLRAVPIDRVRGAFP